MLKKEFLLFMHADWSKALIQLKDDLERPGDRADTLRRIDKANEWIAHYAGRLLALHHSHI